jgi:hypothetical protein
MDFETQADLDAYIEHQDYGRVPERPGVCFAFTVHEHVENLKYELELFFNDAVVLDYRSIPPQDEAAVDDSDSLPAFREYAFYSYNGFAYI